MDENQYNIVKVRDDKNPIKYSLNCETQNFDLVDQANLEWCNGSSFTKN